MKSFGDLIVALGDYGNFHGDALEVIEKSQKRDDLELSEMTNEEIRKLSDRENEKRRFIESIEGAMTVIVDAVNRQKPEDVADAMFMGLTNHHRTLQACTIAAVVRLLKLYRHASHDARNVCAVATAEIVTEAIEETNAVIPLI